MKQILLSCLKKVARSLPVGVLAAVAMQASAATVTYFQTGHGTGTLNGVAFDSYFAITAVADTANVASCGGACLTNTNLSAMIYIDSLGPVTFITQTRYFSSNSGVGGFSREGGADLFDMPSFPAWDMVSSIGPVIGTADLSQWGLADVITTGGVLYFDTLTTPSAFTASVSQVPVPAAAWLFGSGLFGLAGCARRKSA
ncbi:MAG TPA: VPLPA-CTERM sorting domain-containing protein [Spongiibacteraceae bacterium]|nr:VPLPA-CTERM sorting domain-containing protein [Spongiibacteraceae bacterium]